MTKKQIRQWIFIFAVLTFFTVGAVFEITGRSHKPIVLAADGSQGEVIVTDYNNRYRIQREYGGSESTICIPKAGRYDFGVLSVDMNELNPDQLEVFIQTMNQYFDCFTRSYRIPIIFPFGDVS